MHLSSTGVHPLSRTMLCRKLSLRSVDSCTSYGVRHSSRKELDFCLKDRVLLSRGVWSAYAVMKRIRTVREKNSITDTSSKTKHRFETIRPLVSATPPLLPPHIQESSLASSSSVEGLLPSSRFSGRGWRDECVCQHFLEAPPLKPRCSGRYWFRDSIPTSQVSPYAVIILITTFLAST